MAGGLNNVYDMPKVYIVGAQAEGTDNAMSTIRNFPNPPAGARMADIRPPTLLPSPKPNFQDGTAGAAAANAAPSI
jgi:hypothetical protein